ncbi:hypothetical protein M4D79_01055 [Mycolicibacterium novocastrense]|nr:hypothetical protein M4D79_01055 [Mycolicibacterium novocastrense]
MRPPVRSQSAAHPHAVRDTQPNQQLLTCSFSRCPTTAPIKQKKKKKKKKKIGTSFGYVLLG